MCKERNDEFKIERKTGVGCKIYREKHFTPHPFKKI